ncbi:MAG: DUF1573 domain-containing protein [Rikenellaceae bacterium]
MKHYLSLILLLIYILTPHAVRSQELTFESLTFDFGTIAEDGGGVTHIFSYKNTGDKPAVIVAAVSSCGCTVPEYSRQPIAAGSSSTIKVTYDPMDRPGKFSKTIQVVIAPHNKKYVLTITGDVTPRTKSVEERYPFEMGEGLRFASNYYALSHIEQGEIKKSQVSYINTSKRAITIALRPDKESGVLEVEAPQSIAAGESGTFEVGYDLRKNRGYYGLLNDKYIVEVNGKESKYRLMVNAHGIDDFTKEERSAPPIVSRDKSTIRFGELKRGQASQKQSFTLENSGVSELVVRQVELGEGINSNITVGDRVAAGDSRKFQLWVDKGVTSYGSFSRYLTLTLNDPDQPVVRVRATATIVD